MSVTNISYVSLPDPCINAAFLPPIYEFSNFTVIKGWQWDRTGNETVVENFRGYLNFTVHDTANNYSLLCDWGYREYVRGYTGKAEDWGWLNCVPQTGAVSLPESRTVTLMNLNHTKNLWENKSLQSPIRIAQHWYCDIVNGSYPFVSPFALAGQHLSAADSICLSPREVYQAHVDFFADTACPAVGRKSTPAFCNVTTPLPAIVKPLWVPPGSPYPGTPRLAPHLSAAPTSRGISPPPSRDCTDVSFTYPDWTIHDFTYKEPASPDNPTTASLDMSLTSRATGVRVRCRWGAEYNVTERWAVVVDYIIIPVCAPEDKTSDPLNSNSTFALRHDTVNKMLYIQQDWVCGDVAGTYSCVKHEDLFPTWR